MNEAKPVVTSTMSAQSWAGLLDVIESFRRAPLWFALGWHDFAGHYDRTRIGPFWTTLGVGVWVAGLGVIFGSLLQHGSGDFPAYLASGVVLWNFLSNTLSASANVFVRNSAMIFSINNPLYTYVLRQVVEHSSKSLFQVIVFVAVLPFSQVHYGRVMLMALPGMAIVLLTALWVVPLMGMLGARFRDLPFALNSIMRFLFFTTPVFWKPEGLGERAYLAEINPFTHFLEVVRAPLLGNWPSVTSWIVVLSISIPGLMLTVLLYNRFRREIVFWL